MGTGYLVPANREGMFAAAAQVDVNHHVAGLGASAAAGVGKTRRYAAICGGRNIPRAGLVSLSPTN